MKLIARKPGLGYLDSHLWVPKTEINVEGVKNTLTFPVESKAGAYEYLYLYQEAENHLIIPRAFWDPKDLPFEVVDCRPTVIPRVTVHSKIQLDFKDPSQTTQRDAQAALLAFDGGTLQLRCGGGKTVITLDTIAKLGTPALIVVDNTQLMEQWLEEIDKHLVVPGGVGRIQDEHFDWQKAIVMATYQTLAKRADEMSEEVRRWFGHIWFDEGHHVGAPVFSRSAALIYHRRYALTATAHRLDGSHVIYQYHLGPVLYKNLKQPLTPTIQFYWTGLSLDMTDPSVASAVEDCTGQIHTSKLAVYCGHWKTRLDLITKLVEGEVKQTKKTLVLSNSVAELVNLLAYWNDEKVLYTDVLVPTPKDVGEALEPKELSALDIQSVRNGIALAKNKLRAASTPYECQHHEETIRRLETRLARHAVFKKVDALLRQRQRVYLEGILSKTGPRGQAALLIGSVQPKKRLQMIAAHNVIFSIARFGREGLNCPEIETVIICEPPANKNSIQQIMGRSLRDIPGRHKSPKIIILEDQISVYVGFCQKLRSLFRFWPADEGGPYTYQNVGRPTLAIPKRTP